MDLNALTVLLKRSDGYLRVNRTTDQLETIGGSFFGRVVAWIRFQFDEGFRDEILDAKRRIVSSVLSDKTYGLDFRQKIEELKERNGLFYDDKPLSARNVHRFISEVQTEKIHRTMYGKNLVKQLSGKGDTIASYDSFDERVRQIASEKLKGVPGINISDLGITSARLKAEQIEIAETPFKEFADEVHREALKNQDAVARIKNTEQARAYVDKVIVGILDQRLIAARRNLQNKLHRRLAASGLPDVVKDKVAAQIAAAEIVTAKELDKCVNELVVKQIEGEFKELLDQVWRSYNFFRPFADTKLVVVKKELLEELVQRAQDTPLSVVVARAQARQSLGQWVENKKAAFLAIQPSRFAGVKELLDDLVMHDPYMGKVQVVAFQQAIEETLEKAYTKNRATYDTLGMDRGKFLSKLQQFNYRSNLLFSDLAELLQQTPKPNSVLAAGDWQATGIVAIVEDYIKVADAAVESCAKVSALKEKVPDRIVETMMDRIKDGYVLDEDLIAEANRLHITALTEHGCEGLYRLLATPQVADKKIGSKEDLKDFTLNDLLRSMYASKSIKKNAGRRKAIDEILSPRIRDELLVELKEQLGTENSRVMNEADATALFQRTALGFLNELKISFEQKQITRATESGNLHDQTYYSTPL